MEALKKPARRKKQHHKFNPQDPHLYEIYKEIIEYNEEKMQVKPHKVKVSRHQILNFLCKRYGPRFSKKVLANFQFPTLMTFEEYCSHI